jgi:co-chaperonin GroES (HSP10)
MKIEPSEGKVYIKIDEAKAGVLDTSSRNTAVEYAEVISVGNGVEEYKPKDKVFVKAWAVDIVTYEDKRYYFVDIKTGGILAKIK